MNLIEPIVQFQHELQAIRRDLHAHPEVAFEEHRTSDIVAAKLTEYGIRVERGLGGTGVVGIIEGRSTASGRSIALRADMDALPMPELNTFAHASQVPGKMHACGHDGHTTMLLGAARHLAATRDFDGTVYLLFQPAEEGGNAGAQAMIRDGLFERFPADAVFGIHNWPGMPVGTFGVAPGPLMASSNKFDIVLRGKGGHAAQPHLSVDPIMAGVQIAQALQTIVSRNRDPIDAAVISLTQFHGGSAYNVIPEEVVLRGTVRTFSTEVLDMIETRMRAIVELGASSLGATGELHFQRAYPPTLNHKTEAAFVAQVLKEVVGPENVTDPIAPTMGAEDFSFMLLERPGCYFFAGNGVAGEHRDAGHGPGPCSLHNGSYDFNDDLLPLGATVWVRLVQAWFDRQA